MTTIKSIDKVTPQQPQVENGYFEVVTVIINPNDKIQTRMVLQFNKPDAIKIFGTNRVKYPNLNMALIAKLANEYIRKTMGNKHQYGVLSAELRAFEPITPPEDENNDRNAPCG